MHPQTFPGSHLFYNYLQWLISNIWPWTLHGNTQVETLLCLTLKALVLLQPEDLADVLDAARREFIAVFSHLVRGLREHQVPAFAASGAKVPAVRALVVLQQRQNTGTFK